MVLRLKTWESRSPPNLQSTGYRNALERLQSQDTGRLKSSPGSPAAGWSSPVARQAHNLKVVGSNPTPATRIRRLIKRLRAALRGGVCVPDARCYVGATATGNVNPSLPRKQVGCFWGMEWRPPIPDLVGTRGE